MADTLVSGDTAPLITATLHDFADPTDILDLTDSTVRFQMRRSRDRRLMIDRAADIVTAASGTVSYSLRANDTAIPGDYIIEWQVTYPDGSKQTTADVKEVTIRRR